MLDSSPCIESLGRYGQARNRDQLLELGCSEARHKMNSRTRTVSAAPPPPPPTLFTRNSTNVSACRRRSWPLILLFPGRVALNHSVEREKSNSAATKKFLKQWPGASKKSPSPSRARANSKLAHFKVGQHDGEANKKLCRSFLPMCPVIYLCTSGHDVLLLSFSLSLRQMSNSDSALVHIRTGTYTQKLSQLSESERANAIAEDAPT